MSIYYALKIYCISKIFYEIQMHENKCHGCIMDSMKFLKYCWLKYISEYIPKSDGLCVL